MTQRNLPASRDAIRSNVKQLEVYRRCLQSIGERLSARGDFELSGFADDFFETIALSVRRGLDFLQIRTDHKKAEWERDEIFFYSNSQDMSKSLEDVIGRLRWSNIVRPAKFEYYDWLGALVGRLEEAHMFSYAFPSTEKIVYYTKSQDGKFQEIPVSRLIRYAQPVAGVKTSKRQMMNHSGGYNHWREQIHGVIIGRGSKPEGILPIQRLETLRYDGVIAFVISKDEGQPSESQSLIDDTLRPKFVVLKGYEGFDPADFAPIKGKYDPPKPLILRAEEQAYQGKDSQKRLMPVQLKEE